MDVACRSFRPPAASARLLAAISTAKVAMAICAGLNEIFLCFELTKQDVMRVAYDRGCANVGPDISLFGYQLQSLVSHSIVLKRVDFLR